MMSTLVERVAAVRKRVDVACHDAGRSPTEVRLLPVSKTHGIEKIRELSEIGYQLFGENRVQEMVAKNAELESNSPIRWALIGHLQTNKARLAAQVASEFHALDSLKLARVLDRACDALGRRLDVYIQVNSSGEESKFGLDPNKVVGFARQLESHHSLRVVGLMTLAVFSEDKAKVSACFHRMAEVRQQLRDEGVLGIEWDELSMGMSGDFELAIAHGATVVRVGEAIFGRRLTPQDYWPGNN